MAQRKRLPPRHQQPITDKPIRVKPPLKNTVPEHTINFTSKTLADRTKVKRPWKTYLWYFLLAILGSGLAASIGVFVYILLILKDLPGPEELANYTLVSSTKILARDGSLLYEVGDDGARRTVVNLDQINQHMINATLAAEDDDFFTHPGFDWKGIARALYRDAMNKIVGNSSLQGGSTITQQFVKLAFLTPEKTLKRKVSELILSIELEQHFSKEQILEMYLNKVFYGNQSYGVQAAAQTYFRKDAKQLTIAESATLAAIAQLPSYYSPYNNKEALLKRQKFILDRMHTAGFLNDAEYHKANNDELTFAPYNPKMSAPHFVFYILEELSKTYGNELQGLNVYTTLDPKLQSTAEKIVNEGALKNEKSHGVSNAALVSIDPKTGEILSMVGSRDYFDPKIDGNYNVAIAKRQPGSTFKPFTYATLFSKGFGTGTVFFDVKTDFGSGYIPYNYDGKFRGPVTVRTALSNSLNIPAVAAQYLAGVEDTLSQIHNMGVDYLNKNNAADTGLALALGVEEVTPLDMAKAYSVFANNGKKVSVGGILKITNDKNTVLWERKVENTEQVLDPQAAYLINNILSDNNARPANWTNLVIPNRTVAVKTGTSIDIVNNVKKPKDLWTIGYTPSLVTAVWAGNNKGNISVLTADGITNAASIWKAFMTKALENKPKEEFSRPAEIKEVAISTTSGLLPSAATPSDKIRTELFPDYGVPTKVEEDYLSARVDQVSGKLATEQCSQNVALYVYQNFHSILYYQNPQDPALKRWEEGVQSWANNYRKENGSAKISNPSGEQTIPVVYVDSVSKIPTEQCQVLTPEDFGIVLISPIEGGKVVIGPNRADFAIHNTNDIRKVAVYFDGKPINEQDFPPFDQLVFTIPESENGSVHALRFVFTLLDSTQISLPVGIVIGTDNSPPQITLHEPRENSRVHPGETFQINTTVHDEKGINRVEFYFDQTKIMSMENSPYITSFTLPIDTQPGPHKLEIKAYDKEENIGRVSISMIVETTPLSITSPSSNTLDIGF